MKISYNKFIVKSPSSIRSLGRLLFAVTVCCSTASTASAENWEGAEVKKTVVDANPPAAGIISVAYSFTRNGCRAAALSGALHDGFSVRVDGKEGPRYSKIREETPLFSANGKSVAYCAQKDNKWRWVINGVEGPSFQKLTPTSFAFSEDGKRHAYVANGSILVVDGKAVPAKGSGKPIPYDAAPAFSPDSKRLVYVEWLKAERKMRIVQDGKPGGWSVGVSMSISSGFGALINARGKAAQPPKFGLDFSADSQHFAYSQFNGTLTRIVVNGKPEPAYQNLGIDFVFSPDGSDFAYMAYPDGKRSIVRKTSLPFAINDLVDGTLTFSPAGKQLAFVGIRDAKMALWLNEKAVSVNLPPGHRIEAPRFSPDSKRLAYPVGKRGPSRCCLLYTSPSPRDRG